jgi:hypothetical protein
MNFRSLVLAACFSCAVVGSAKATVVAAPPPSANPADFNVIETPGQYEVFNNSTTWYITGFTATNPMAGAPGVSESTGEAGWAAFNSGTNLVGTPSAAFGYFNISGTSLANDIAPDTSSDKFFFQAPEASVFTLFLTNATGATAQVVEGVPEPSTWAMMILGFVGLGFMASRRKSTLRFG